MNYIQHKASLIYIFLSIWNFLIIIFIPVTSVSVSGAEQSMNFKVIFLEASDPTTLRGHKNP